MFRDQTEVREITEKWRQEYNNARPHTAQGNKTPAQVRHEYRTLIALPDANVAI